MGDNGAALGQVTAAVGDGAGALVGLGGLAVDARLPRGGEGADIEAGDLGVALNDRVDDDTLVFVSSSICQTNFVPNSEIP